MKRKVSKSKLCFPLVGGLLNVVLLGLVPSAYAQVPEIYQALPNVAAPGDRVKLLGSGFALRPQDNLVFVEGNDGRGAVLETLRARSDRLKVRVGVVEAPLNGTLRMVTGHDFALTTGTVFARQHGVYVLEEASWFSGDVVSSSAGPQFVVPSGIPGVIEAEPGPSGWAIWLPFRNLNPSMQGSIVIGSCDGAGGDGPDDPFVGGVEGAQGSLWQSFAFRIGYAPRNGGALPAAVLAADLAAILGATFGDLGLLAGSAGDRLTLDHDCEPTQLFAVLRLAATNPSGP